MLSIAIFRSCRTTYASSTPVVSGFGFWGRITLWSWELAKPAGRAGRIWFFYPNISSVQACFHHLGFAWQEAQIISLHGRPLSVLRRYLKDQQLIALFTDQHANPVAIAAELFEQGFAESQIWICQAMGSKQQRITQYRADALATLQPNFHPLNICVVQLRGHHRLCPLSRASLMSSFPQERNPALV